MYPRLYSAYEHGYYAGAAEQPRVVPIEFAQALPDRSDEWCRGYDDAVSDLPDVQRQMLAGFAGNSGGGGG